MIGRLAESNVTRPITARTARPTMATMMGLRSDSGFMAGRLMTATSPRGSSSAPRGGDRDAGRVRAELLRHAAHQRFAHEEVEPAAVGGQLADLGHLHRQGVQEAVDHP